MGKESSFFFSSFLLSLLLINGAFGLKDVTKSSTCSTNFLENHPYLTSGELSGSTILTLHHAHGPCSPLDLPSSTITDLLRHDSHRVHLLNSRLFPNHTSNLHHFRLTDPLAASTVNIPLSPGISLGVGNYVTKIGLGTPAKDYFVVVDTGSSLSWLQCQPCTISCYSQVGPIFDPKASTSYFPVGCSSPECVGLQATTLNPSACSKAKVCIYQASYGDSSFSVGYLGRDALAFGKSKILSNFVYGCGQDNEGLFGKAAGLIGLAKDKLSLLGQLSATAGNSFSYCLPTTSSSGYLSFGPVSPAKYTYTPIVSSSLDKSLYFIKLTAITVGKKPIPVPASTYSSSPTIIDSGTVITRLPDSVYTALSDAVVKSLARYAKAPAYSILETCFKGTYKALPVPPVSLVFAGGAELALSAHNVFYDLTSNGITCLAFAKSSSVTIIGNRQQQTFSVAYDVGRSRIGFAAGGCM